MIVFEIPFFIKKQLLAMGPESEGVFAFYRNKQIIVSDNFGDLIEENNFLTYKKEINKLLKKFKPDIILTDLHPLYNSTIYGEELGRKLNLPVIKIQHHLAHIFSTLGEQILSIKYQIPDRFFGIACDGTGYGLDGKIWGGEIFKLKIYDERSQTIQIERVGHLENQILIGGDLAVKQPARMLISILSKFLKKKEIYSYLKKYYSQNEFELLFNQLKENFNCQEASSTARILDAVSILLDFCPNQRTFKHEPAFLLEKNSTLPYSDLKPEVYLDKDNKYQLLTTPLFQYLIKNLNRDKKRLAATAQIYIAKGIWEILKKIRLNKTIPIFFAGGISNNKIISQYLERQGVIINKIIPRGDAGISFGQIIYYLTNSRN